MTHTMGGSPTTPMLTNEIIRRVREIQIRTGRHVADVLAGQYVSAFKGQGVEFEEVRPYVPGDDVRTIDWNVTGRMGSPYVKRYVEERQLSIMLMTDISASQDFGSANRSKREATAELSALLAFSAIQNDDKVGLTLFHGGIEQYVPPRKGQKHVLRVVREVLMHGMGTPEMQAPENGASPRRRLLGRRPRRPREATDIARAMEFLMSVAKRRMVCFVVSDFFDDDFVKAMSMANQKHDVVAVHVSDERERVMAGAGLVTLTDPETGRSGLYDTGSKAFRESFERESRRRIERLKQAFGSAHIDFVSIDASGSVVEPLVRFFRLRERRRR